MLFSLALKDLWFEKLLSLCLIATVASILAPLLLLFSLRTGVLNELEQNLVLNPTNLEITFGANYRLDKTFIKSLEEDPHVGFVVPLTRSLDVTCDVQAARKIARFVSAVPSAKDDPILKAAYLEDLKSDQEIYLSESLADKLEVKAGQEIKLIVRRVLNGKNQNGIAKFIVHGVIPNHLISQDRMLVTLNTVTFMEDYRDGFEPLIFSDGSKLNDKRTVYAKVRLYAKDIYSVEPLVKKLDKDYRINSKLAQIQEVKAITSVLDTIFKVIATVTILGGVLCFIGLTISSLARKERSFAMLRVMGLEGFSLHLLVLFENVILALGGFLLAGALCLLGSAIFNEIFKEALGQRNLSFLTFEAWGIFALATLLGVSVISLSCTKFAFRKAQISDILREG